MIPFSTFFSFLNKRRLRGTGPAGGGNTVDYFSFLRRPQKAATMQHTRATPMTTMPAMAPEPEARLAGVWTSLMTSALEK